MKGGGGVGWVRGGLGLVVRWGEGGGRVGGVLVRVGWVVCYGNYNFPRSTNKIKFFDQTSTSI